MIKFDPASGFCEFPAPGDTKRQLLNHLIDLESITLEPADSEDAKAEITEDMRHQVDEREYWMPDRLCKVCYSCEDAFTMYRRRHHCRMCGQVFCDRCSSYYIDGLWINLQGPVRACKFCNEQLATRIEKESNKVRLFSATNQSQSFAEEMRRLSIQQPTPDYHSNLGTMKESHQAKIQYTNELQQRASEHLQRIVEHMLSTFKIRVNVQLWRDIIVNLVKEVVSTVDPTVRHGDSMDIRNYVKIKIIPGGSMEGSVYVDGVVFRKNVCHKKMVKRGQILKPRVLLLGGGIEFQRSDVRFSSLETLVEQENKYLEILVEKILSLKPDVIIVGKSISRKAQELLCDQNLVALQNVKGRQLERISRMLDATILPTTDHMVQENGDECIGCSGRFSINLIQDDPERIDKPRQYKGILKDRVCRGSSYAIFDGCPPERGCSIILRGECRKVLRVIKRILKFSISVAYHLRLEVAYYNDRYARIPEKYDEDDEDSDIEEWGNVDLIDNAAYDINVHHMKNTRERKLLSTSLSVDICLPYISPIRGIQLADSRGYPSHSSLAIDYQGISFTSIIMGENAQKSKSEVRSMSFYDEADSTLGRFLIDRCFRHNNKDRENLVGNTLTFVHRTGRLEFEISLKEGEHSNAIIVEDGESFLDPVNLPIYTSSYCNVCENWVTPYECLSEESWKMSFGKFLEMTFYNRSAICRTGDCSHSIRDCHVLSFFCHTHEGRFQARVKFQRFFPFSLRTRKILPFEPMFHHHETIKYLNGFSTESSTTISDFKRILSVLEKEVMDTLQEGDERFDLAIQDIQMIHQEINVVKNEIETTLECTLALLFESSGEYSCSTSSFKPYELKKKSEDSLLSDQKIHRRKLEEELVRDVSYPIELKYPMVFSNYLLSKAQEWNRMVDTWHQYLASQAPAEISGSISVSQNLEIRESNTSEGELINFDAELISQNVWKNSSQNLPGCNHDPLLIHEAISSRSVEDKGVMSSSRGVMQLDGINTKENNDLSIIENSEEIRVQESFSSETFNEKKMEETTQKPLTSEIDGLIGVVNESPGEVKPVPIGKSIAASRTKSTEKERQRSIFGGKKLSQAFARFRFGSSNKQEESAVKFNVPLNDLIRGRFSLKPGKRGEVIAVNEDDIASIISYSLASEEYSQKFNNEISEYEIDQLDVVPTYSKTDSEIQEREESSGEKKSLEIVDDADDTKIYKKDEVLVEPSSSISGIATIIKQSMEFTKLSSIEEKQIPHLNKTLQYIQQMKLTKKNHVKHRFEDKDEYHNVSCKFICHTFWATQFRAIRAVFLQDETDEGFIRSLALSATWNAQGGKSGAAFSKSLDGRFVVKCISRTELQMFLEIATEYFKYLADTYVYTKSTVLCKIYGIYQVGYHNKFTGKKVMEQVVVMENVFYDRNITRIFDLKGSSRARYTPTEDTEDFDTSMLKRREAKKTGALYMKSSIHSGSQVLMDDNLMELTKGLPFPMKNLANKYLQSAIENDTEFLSSVNIVDYSILVGIDEDNLEVSVGIIDYMRQYDIIKRVERMGKSVGMIAGQAEPTIIQPNQYKKRFRLAMERNFMAVPDKYDFS
mgnify:CR=1 FL=1